MFFGGFLCQSNHDQKIKGTVVWLLIGIFWGSMSLDCFDGFLDQITTEKKVQLFGHQLQCLEGSMNSDCFGGFFAMFFGGFLDQITNYDWKKRYSRLAIGWNVYYVLLTHFEWGLFLWRAHCYQNQYGK
jgi:hypothetical protein